MREIERLTKRYPKTNVADLVFKDDSIPCRRLEFVCPSEHEPCDTARCDLAIVIERLARYEDTKLSPDEIVLMKKKLKTLQDKVKAMKK